MSKCSRSGKNRVGHPLKHQHLQAGGFRHLSLINYNILCCSGTPWQLFDSDTAMSPLITQHVSPNGLCYFLLGALVILGSFALFQHYRRAFSDATHPALVKSEHRLDLFGPKISSNLTYPSATVSISPQGEARPSPLQLHLKSIYEEAPHPPYIGKLRVLKEFSCTQSLFQIMAEPCGQLLLLLGLNGIK